MQEIKNKKSEINTELQISIKTYPDEFCNVRIVRQKIALPGLRIILIRNKGDGVMSIGWQEILLIFLIVLLFFGARRLPEVARSLGKAINELKKAKNDADEDPTKKLDSDEYKSSEPGKPPAEKFADAKPEEDQENKQS